MFHICISILKEGQYFGESAVLASTKQVHSTTNCALLPHVFIKLTARCVQPCPFTAVAMEQGAELYVLDRTNLQEILVFYPKIQQKMIQVYFFSKFPAVANASHPRVAG
jgi:CRP-like cAMP-binding protein